MRGRVMSLNTLLVMEVRPLGDFPSAALVGIYGVGGSLTRPSLRSAGSRLLGVDGSGVGGPDGPRGVDQHELAAPASHARFGKVGVVLRCHELDFHWTVETFLRWLHDHNGALNLLASV